MNVIVRLLSCQPFLDRVADELAAAARGRTVSVPSPSGVLSGEIKNYRLLSRPLFADSNIDCIGHTCSLPFSGRAEASGYGQTEEGGGWLPFSKEGEYFGQVDLSWPDEARVETPGEFEALYPRIIVNLVLESTGLDDLAPLETAPDVH